MVRHDKVRLTVALNSHEERRPEIVAGTEGLVLATRHHPTDDGPQALVKFKGWGTPRSVAQSSLEVV
jgi:hypothetical protein